MIEVKTFWNNHTVFILMQAYQSREVTKKINERNKQKHWCSKILNN